jgi:hypothetical protein
MTASLRPDSRLIALAAIASIWTVTAAGQTLEQHSTGPTLGAVKTRVPAGGTVIVSATTGATLEGKLVAVTDDAVRVRVGTNVRSVPAADVERIQWKQPDSPMNGLLIGAAVGAIPGIYWLVVDPNECSGMCPEEYALIAIGAVAGGVIDRIIKKTTTVYSAGSSSGRAKTVVVRPLISKDRQGLGVTLRF